MWSSPCGPFQRRAVMGSGDSPRVVISTPDSGDSPRMVRQRGQSLCGHSFLTQRRRRVYGVERSFYRRCFNRFQMSELEIELELFAVHFALTGSGDSPRVGIFRRHPERIFQWEENRSVPAENNMSERGVRRTVIARKVCVRWTRASASLTCSSRCRHTRQNSVGDGRGPVAFRKSGEKPHMPFRQWEDPESRLRLRTRRLEKLRCTFAQMLRCRGRSRPR